MAPREMSLTIPTCLQAFRIAKSGTEQGILQNRNTSARPQTATAFWQQPGTNHGRLNTRSSEGNFPVDAVRAHISMSLALFSAIIGAIPRCPRDSDGSPPARSARPARPLQLQCVPGTTQRGGHEQGQLPQPALSHFRPRRHLMAADAYDRVHAKAFRIWRQ